MKQEFSTSWKSSKQPRKQRKYNHNAPLHLQRKMLSAHLDKELRKKYSRRSLELRKGDEVKIMRGKFKKKQGKVDTVNLKKAAVSIEGIQNTKKDGTKTAVWIHASKLKITAINSEDKKRFKTREKKAEPAKTKPEIKHEAKKIKQPEKENKDALKKN